jgi:dTMP kinase
VLELNLAVVGGLLPDVTVLLRLGPAEAAARLGSSLDRIEREGEGLLAAAAGAYDELARRFPERYLTVDATGTPDAIVEEIVGAVRRRP